MKLLYLPVFIFLSFAPAILVADPIDNVANLIRQANISELSKLFAENIEVSILGDENTYSKAQAAVVLNKFFNENKPRSIKMLHKVNSNPNYRFAVLIMTTDKGTYRVAFTLKETDGSLALIELRIETEKVK